MHSADYTRFLIKEPRLPPGSGTRVENAHFPPFVYLSSAQVPGVQYYIEFGWVWGMPHPNPLGRAETGTHDEIVINIGGDSRQPEDLGADIEYTLGGQSLKISTTSAIFVPKGVSHGPLTYRSFRKPHVRIAIIVGAGERQPLPANGAPSGGPAAVDYEKYLVRKPTYEVIAGTPVRHRQGPSSMTLMNENLVPGCHIYIEGGWVWGMPDPNPHIFEHGHDYEEIVLHFGADYRHPQQLGAKIEFCVGESALNVDRTSAVYVPRGVKHGPLTWQEYSAPHLEMAIMPGAGTLAQADPGGHQEKMKRRSQSNG